MKIRKSTIRRDAIEDHRHRLDSGDFTGGALMKPCKDQSAMHTHLYEFEEDTYETGPMHNEPGHTHSSQHGPVSAPMSMQKQPGEPWQKMDSLQREGKVYVLRSAEGNVISRGFTAKQAMEHYDAFDADEAVAKHSFENALGEKLDDAKWEKDKEASKSSVGAIKWPLVQHLYQQMS